MNDTEAAKALLNKPKQALEELAKRYDEIMGNTQTAEELETERDQKIRQIEEEYDSKIANVIDPEEAKQIRGEARKQLTNLKNIISYLNEIGIEYGPFSIEIPDDFQKEEEVEQAPERPRRGRKPGKAKEVSKEVKRLPRGQVRGGTIEEKIAEMFDKLDNKPMSPREIISYLKEDMKLTQTEASIRTQLHNLKLRNVVTKNEKDGTYKINKRMLAHR